MSVSTSVNMSMSLSVCKCVRQCAFVFIYTYICKHIHTRFVFYVIIIIGTNQDIHEVPPGPQAVKPGQGVDQTFVPGPVARLTKD